MDFPERLKTIIRVNNLTSSSFADRVGVQRSGVSHILNGRNKPSMEFLLKVLEAFPRVDAGWLLTGKTTQKLSSEGVGVSEESNTLDSEGGDQIEIAKDKQKPVLEKIVFFYSDSTFDTFNPISEQ
ncbi:MAG: helix-turn-helix domain-containing protein [Flavobacteriales bacterium]|nr:helix-turn-helix domain-containing protein [Flavobacteriales bacterium]